jgi:hypothetical protein
LRLGSTEAVVLQILGKTVSQDVMLLLPLLGDNRLDGLPEQDLVTSRGCTHHIDQQI